MEAEAKEKADADTAAKAAEEAAAAEKAKDGDKEAVTESKKVLEEIKQERFQTLCEAKLATSKLQGMFLDAARDDLTNSKRILEAVEIDQVVKKWRDRWAAVEQQYGSGRVRGVPSSLIESEGGGEAWQDRQLIAIDGMFANADLKDAKGDTVPRHKSFKEAYSRWVNKDVFDVTPFEMMAESVCNYDSAIQGKKLLESATTATWANVFADRLFRKMIQDYNLEGLSDWQKIVSNKENVSDFRPQRFTRVGGYGLLTTVAEGATYPTLTSPTDEAFNFSLTKKGGLDDITFEMIANDDLRQIRNIPTKLARAAAQTLYRFVFDFLRLGFTAGASAIYDTFALFDSANHANIPSGAPALGDTGLGAGWQLMRAQTAFGNTTEKLGTRPKYLVVPNNLEQLAWRLANSLVTILGSNFNATEPNFFKGIEVIVVDYFTDANDWFLVGDPAKIPTIELGFFNGQEDPELFVQDQPNVGSVMTADKITYKIRHIYNGAVADWRGFVGSNPA